MKRLGSIFPQALTQGDTVFLFAPGTAVKEPYRQQGRDLLLQAGFLVQNGHSLDEPAAPFAAGPPEIRTRDWQTALDAGVPAILPARGGYGCVHLLGQAPFQETAARAPLWIGASDCTYLQVPLLQHYGLVTLYGPMPCGQLADPNEPGRDAFVDALHGRLPESYATPETEQLVNGNATGELRGGCLSIIAALCGTPNQLDTTDALLILEDVGEHPYRIERMLYQLAQAGLFAACRGVLFGTFPGCTDRTGNPTLVYDILRRFSLTMQKPTLMNLPLGHGRGAQPIGLGIMAEISDGFLKVRESPVL